MPRRREAAEGEGDGAWGTHGTVPGSGGGRGRQRGGRAGRSGSWVRRGSTAAQGPRPSLPYTSVGRRSGRRVIAEGVWAEGVRAEGVRAARGFQRRSTPVHVCLPRPAPFPSGRFAVCCRRRQGATGGDKGRQGGRAKLPKTERTGTEGGFILRCWDHPWVGVRESGPPRRAASPPPGWGGCGGVQSPVSRPSSPRRRHQGRFSLRECPPGFGICASHGFPGNRRRRCPMHRG